MATRCTKCGSFLNDGERFCPNCGENAPQPVPQAPQYGQQYNQQYTQYGQPGQPGGQRGGYVAPMPVPTYSPLGQQEEEMSTGKWVGLLLLTNFLGLISWILLFVWGFGSGPKARQNYCRAMLIVKAVSVFLVIIISVASSAWLIPALERFIEESGGHVYSSYDGYFNEFTAFIGGLFR